MKVESQASLMPTERRERTLAYIREHKSCRIEELAELLQVSRVTVHRILDELASAGVVEKVRGGVRLTEAATVQSQFAQRLRLNVNLKKEIAEKAVGLVSDGDAIFLDSSTTCYYFGLELLERPLVELTIVTNAPAVVCALTEHPAFQVISTGGEVHHQLNALVGPLALQAIDQLHFNKVFVSAAAVTLGGFMVGHSVLRDVISRVLTRKVDTTLLADSTKFDRVGPIPVAALHAVARIVSDTRLPAETGREYARHKVTIL